MTAALGRGERERGRGEEWARESERGTGQRVASSREARATRRGSRRWRGDVATACVVPGFSSAYWQEVEDGAAPGGLGRQVGWPAGSPGKSGKSFLISCFLFYFLTFVLI